MAANQPLYPTGTTVERNTDLPPYFQVISTVSCYFPWLMGCHLSGISRLSQKFPIVLASPMVFTLFPGSFHLMSRLFPKSHFFLCVPWFSRCFYPISNLFSPHFQVISKLSFFSCLLPWFHAISSLLSKIALVPVFSMVVTAVFLRVFGRFSANIASCYSQFAPKSIVLPSIFNFKLPC